MHARSQHDFGDVFDRHFDDVYAYVAYRVAPDREAAGDITQDVFLAAFQGFAGFAGRSSMLTWLRSIARRKVADFLRGRLGAPARMEGGVEHLVARGNPAPAGTQDQGLLVSLIMRRLPDNYVELLEDKYLEDLSVKEMARRQGMSEKAVESALSRARASFREIYCRLQGSQDGET